MTYSPVTIFHEYYESLRKFKNSQYQARIPLNKEKTIFTEFE